MGTGGRRSRASAAIAVGSDARAARRMDSGFSCAAQSRRDHYEGIEMDRKQITRRWFFEQCGVGLGVAALADLLGQTGFAASDPLSPKQPHFAPKAKRVIFLFMAGAPSHLEMFDNKPQLAKFDGTLPPADLLKGYRAAFINP